MQPADRTSVAAPVSGRLFFAGEHTSAQYPATVHGAYMSGLAAAASVTAAPTSAPVATPTAPTPVVLYATQTVNTGQSLSQMQAPLFAVAFKAGVEAAVPGVTCTVTSVSAGRRRHRQLLAAAAVSVNGPYLIPYLAPYPTPYLILSNPHDNCLPRQR